MPIVTVSDYLNGLYFSSEIFRNIRGQAETAGLKVDDIKGIKGVDLPSHGRLQALLEETEVLLRGKLSQKTVCAAERVKAGLEIIISAKNGQASTNNESVKKILGKCFEEKVESILRNNLSTDIHFLPGDGKADAFTAIAEHSVVLFRYPITVPFEIMDLADDHTYKDWEQTINALPATFTMAGAFTKRPLRRSTMKTPFYSDLLSRYIALYIRMGSPDFTSETIGAYVQNIGGK